MASSPGVPCSRKRVGWGLIETPADHVLDRPAKSAGADEAHAPAASRRPDRGRRPTAKRCRRVRWRRGCAGSAAGCGAPAVLHRAKLLEPHPPHRLAQRRRTARAVDRHHLSVAIPRRPDRRARAKPLGAGPDHRRRDRRLGDRSRPIPRSPSIPTRCSICSPAKATGRPRMRCTASIFRSIRSAWRRSCGA